MASPTEHLSALPSLPLLARELIATANRRRTYWARALVVACLSAVYLLQYLKAVMSSGGEATAMLGTGGETERALVATCSTVVAAAVLVQSASCFLLEKERGTLATLMLTPLGPWRLALEQWASQLVVAGSMLLLALPLLALGHACGGSPLGESAAAGAALVLLLLQLGAIGILAGCLASSWRAALVLALGLGGLLWLAGALLPQLTPLAMLRIASAAAAGASPTWASLGAALLLPLLAPTLLMAGAGAALARWRERSSEVGADGRARAGAMPGRGLPRMEFMAWLAWRHSFMSRTPYRILLWCALGYALVAAFGDASSNRLHLGNVALANLGTLACVLMLALSSAGVVPIERAGQTLDLLRTAPHAEHRLIAQLHRYHRRMMRIQLAVLGFVLLLSVLVASDLDPFARFAGIQHRDTGTAMVVTLAGLVALRNAFAVVVAIGLMIGAGASSPVVARVRSLMLAFGALVVLPVLVEVLIAALMFAARLLDMGPSMGLVAISIGGCFSPLFTAMVCFQMRGHLDGSIAVALAAVLVIQTLLVEALVRLWTAVAARRLERLADASRAA